MDTLKFKFLKDYENFKEGMYLEIPSVRYTGQINIEIMWQEITNLLLDGTLVKL